MNAPQRVAPLTRDGFREPVGDAGAVARVSEAHPGDRDRPQVRFAYPAYEAEGAFVDE